VILKQVIDIIVQRLENEQSLSHRLNLFYLVDSITQISRNMQGKSGSSNMLFALTNDRLNNSHFSQEQFIVPQWKGHYPEYCMRLHPKEVLPKRIVCSA
jgi:hypothetical protein